MQLRITCYFTGACWGNDCSVYTNSYTCKELHGYGCELCAEEYDCCVDLTTAPTAPTAAPTLSAIFDYKKSVVNMCEANGTGVRLSQSKLSLTDAAVYLRSGCDIAHYDNYLG